MQFHILFVPLQVSKMKEEEVMKESEMVFGIRAVIEAIQAEKEID